MGNRKHNQISSNCESFFLNQLLVEWHHYKNQTSSLEDFFLCEIFSELCLNSLRLDLNLYSEQSISSIKKFLKDKVREISIRTMIFDFNLIKTSNKELNLENMRDYNFFIRIMKTNF
ncbi:hypothetical protein [Candidatus Enterococcus ikei]|uniref:Uncharacterized protein n=1 Tax=Candidatus Enterococcus ikei TaxID=2815326 RepID=A0ABS3GX58_9ENTE|nr:hypothetical protein [Enterococcus sp. DIV0869a]MBO0439400.1 hypothetical protein [Enterococcus sp. DIV0869a]